MKFFKFRFYKDYEIFPDLVNEITLKKIFLNLYNCNILKDLKKNYINNLNNLKISEKLDFKNFLDSIALIGLNIKYQSNLNNIEKIAYILEMINNFKGMEINKIKPVKIK